MHKRTAIVLSCLLLLTVILLPVPTAAAKPPPVQFPPGMWSGRAVWTGDISNGDVSASLASPVVIDFFLNVNPDGTVAEGDFAFNGATINETLGAAGNATAQANGFGTLSGTGSVINMDGTIQLTVEVPNSGIGAVSVDQPSSGSFWPSSVSCTFVWGDLATQGRAVQQGAGFATSVKAPFIAQRTLAPGETGVTSWEASFTGLVDRMYLLADNPHPGVRDMMDIVRKVEDFQTNLITTSDCIDAPPGLEKGTAQYSWFVEKYTELLSKILSDPSGYSGGDISEMLLSAVQIGAVGSAAPDREAAASLENSFKQVLGQKLDADITGHDRDDILLIFLAAEQAGYTDLAARAHSVLYTA